MEYVKDLKEFLESSNIFERRAFLGNFIESIEADDGEMTFNYTLPLPPDNTRQETVSVLGIVPTGPPYLSNGAFIKNSLLPPERDILEAACQDIRSAGSDS